MVRISSFTPDLRPYATIELDINPQAIIQVLETLHDPANLTIAHSKIGDMPPVSVHYNTEEVQEALDSKLLSPLVTSIVKLLPKISHSDKIMVQAIPHNVKGGKMNRYVSEAVYNNPWTVWRRNNLKQLRADNPTFTHAQLMQVASQEYKKTKLSS